MGFADQMKRNGAALERWARAVHEAAADIAFVSIVDGSPLSGAPGQPVAAPIFKDAGALKKSFRKTRTSPDVITISSPQSYAPAIEDNLGGVRFRSGGAHSVKLSVLAAPRIVNAAMQQVGGAK